MITPAREPLRSVSTLTFAQNITFAKSEQNDRLRAPHSHDLGRVHHILIACLGDAAPQSLLKIPEFCSVYGTPINLGGLGGRQETGIDFLDPPARLFLRVRAGYGW
jgi:hypothetical protein